MTSKRTLALMIVPSVLVGAIAIVALLLLDLPEQIAVHWNFEGADRFGTKADLVVPLALVVPLLIAVMVGFFVALSRNGSNTALERFIVGTVNFVGIGIPLTMLGTALAQLSGPDESGATAAVWVCGGLAVGAAAGVGLALLTTPIAVVPAGELGAPALALGDTERAAWSRSVLPSAVPAIVIAASAVVVTVVLIVVGSPVALTVVLLAVFVAAFSLLLWRVRVDNRGILVRSALGIPRFVIAPHQIVEAREIAVDPVRQFGGWGIRFGGLGWGVIVRRGQAIEVVRSDGKANFVVTVDDAATAAALLTAIARRAR